MTCWVCNPVCDHCKPKFVTCPECDDRCFLSEPTCRSCGHVFTDEEKTRARDMWKKTRDTSLSAQK